SRADRLKIQKLKREDHREARSTQRKARKTVKIRFGFLCTLCDFFAQARAAITLAPRRFYAALSVHAVFQALSGVFAAPSPTSPATPCGRRSPWQWQAVR